MLYVFAGKERAGNYDAREDPNWRNGLVRKGAPQSSGACTRLFSRQGLPGPSRDVSCSVKKTYLPAIVKEVRQPSSTYVVAVQSLSRAQLFVTQWTVAHQASLSFTISRSLLKLMSIELLMPSNHLILCRPLLLLPSIFPSIRVFSNELSLHKVAKVLEFQLQHQSFQWIFRVDWFPLRLAGSPCCQRDSQESSPVQKHQSFGTQPYLHIYIYIYIYMSLNHWSVEMAAQSMTNFV